MIHFEVDPNALRQDVPFELDLFNGRAFVSAVAFTMRGMRPRVGGRFVQWLFRPIATHDFLNLRTYVRHRGEPGIHFLAEWLSNSIAVKLGPALFGLPYRRGRISYEHDCSRAVLNGSVGETEGAPAFVYEAKLDDGTAFAPCKPGSLDEWLMERYSAFNAARVKKKFFRVWHPPWLQRTAAQAIVDVSLLAKHWRWIDSAAPAGANFSPGFDTVWMGRPHGIAA